VIEWLRGLFSDLFSFNLCSSSKPSGIPEELISGIYIPSPSELPQIPDIEEDDSLLYDNLLGKCCYTSENLSVFLGKHIVVMIDKKIMVFKKEKGVIISDSENPSIEPGERGILISNGKYTFEIYSHSLDLDLYGVKVYKGNQMLFRVAPIVEFCIDFLCGEPHIIADKTQIALP